MASMINLKLLCSGYSLKKCKKRSKTKPSEPATEKVTEYLTASSSMDISLLRSPY
jgi:hypothetical protein